MTLDAAALTRIAIEAEFVRTCLEVEAEYGGMVFVERAPHCSMWSVRVFWPRWADLTTGGVCEHTSFLKALTYTAPDGGRRDLDYFRAKLIEAIGKLRAREGLVQQERILGLRRELAALEAAERGEAS